MIKHLIIALLCMTAFLLFAYKLKSHRGVDLFDSFSLSESFPFKYLHKPEQPAEHNAVYIPSNVVIIEENFEDGLESGGWSSLWARDRGTVIRRLDRDAEKGTNYIFIRNLGHEDWAIEHDRLIAVSPGEQFHYQGKIKTTEQAAAGLGVAFFDEDMQIMDWMHAARMVQYQAEWTEISNSFIIPEDARFMRFRLAGSGLGEVFADDFLLKKMEISSPDNHQ